MNPPSSQRKTAAFAAAVARWRYIASSSPIVGIVRLLLSIRHPHLLEPFPVPVDEDGPTLERPEKNALALEMNDARFAIAVHEFAATVVARLNCLDEHPLRRVLASEEFVGDEVAVHAS